MLQKLRKFALFAVLVVMAASARAQAPNPQKTAPPAQTKQPPAASDSSSSPAAAAADQPQWDPFHAEQDVEVGTFYMHKGDSDAAIGRFEDAIRLDPKLAKPRFLLAEIYEKKNNNARAVQYYREYLKIYPDAPDAKKVEKKIEKLSKE
ncbi:MAG TPA: tetratricopeptide repeat protein [Candidatus Acidoferrales bacterium]